jgi:hypothetical protein
MNKILDQIDKNVVIQLLNTMYNGLYKYTLNRYREIFRQLVQQSEHKNIITNDVIDNYLINKIQTEYAPHIKKQIEILGNIPLIEQKSPEWFRLREDMISASDAGYFLKKCGISRAIETLKIKLGLKKYVNSNAPPLMHGNTYEDVARAIYESRNKVSVFEHGIISSKTNFIGASPDGIVIQCHDSSFECQSKYGRLLEIKNPYSREIDNEVKSEYMVQILQQQYTTWLPICDFLELTIVDKYCKNTNPNYKAYDSLENMLNDKLDINNSQWQLRIKNKNIPSENLNKFGNEKGLIIWYQKIISDSDTRNKYIHYPLQNKYDSRMIEKWVVDTNSEQFVNGFAFKEIKYWRLDVYSEKTVVYDKKYENEYIPQLDDVWQTVLKCRELQSKGDHLNSIEKYVEDLENRKDSPFYNENKRKKKIKPNLTSTPSTSSCNNNTSIELDF